MKWLFDLSPPPKEVLTHRLSTALHQPETISQEARGGARSEVGGRGYVQMSPQEPEFGARERHKLPASLPVTSGLQPSLPVSG